ncbi:MAG: precorrin-8X methylmutase [Lachnospiraceae bacterium]|nr:precorrin-8X methylmutase [Lachnospiraceae bacterium]
MNKLERIERLLPEEIEKRSFEIITEELNKQGIVLPKENESIIKRAIHTSADFEYAHSLKFSPDAVKKVKELIINGADIVTDTNMALSGINKKVLAKYGGEVHCFMADEEVANEAKQKGATRAYISMQKASAIDKPLIFAIGNAPTALVSLYEMYQRNEYRPAFVIGVPVGFVNVELSKELIMETDIPFIVNEGRKGGSNIAAAICNAILYELDRKA